MSNKQYNSIGSEYAAARSAGLSLKEKASKRFILESVDFSNKVVLDLGCGSGQDFADWKLAGAKSIYGYDSSEKMLEGAKGKGAVQLDLGDINNLPYEESLFEVVIAKHSLHYLSKAEMEKSFARIWDVLKPGGVFVYTVQHPFSEIFLKDSLDYESGEDVKLLAHGKFKLTFPSHTLVDYLSEDFFRKFELIKLFEYTKNEEWTGKFRVPGVLGILAKKKEAHV